MSIKSDNGPSPAAGKKKKNPSKKSKKCWRKSSDIADVEEFLEEKRLEERLGGGSFDDKPNDQLFVLDSATPLENEQKEILSKKELRRRKPLKCFQFLEITGGAQDPKKGRNRQRIPEERKNPIVAAREKKLIQNGIIKEKMKKSLADRADTLAKKESVESRRERSTRRRTKFDFDLWNEDAVDGDKKEFPKDPWFPNSTVLHNLKNTGKLKRKLPKGYFDPTTKLPAVETPEPGISYNPSLKDHKDNLLKAAILEINKEKVIQKIERATTKMFPDAANMPTPQSVLKEMSQGIPGLDPEVDENDDETEEVEIPNKDDEVDADEGDEAEEGYEPKTKKQRRKAKEAEMDEKRRKFAKIQKAKLNEVYRLKSLKKEIVEKEKETEKKKVKRGAKRERKQFYEPKKLSSVKHEAPEMEIKLSEELTGNLRTLKPEGNLLEDRFKSLQRRNIIATTVVRPKVRKGKKRKKMAEKRSHKMGWEPNYRKYK